MFKQYSAVRDSCIVTLNGGLQFQYNCLITGCIAVLQFHFLDRSCPKKCKGRCVPQITHHFMKAYVWEEILARAFVTLALDSVEWTASGSLPLYCGHHIAGDLMTCANVDTEPTDASPFSSWSRTRMAVWSKQRRVLIN